MPSDHLAGNRCRSLADAMFRHLLPSEGTAGRDGSDQHGPDDLFECKYTKLVTSFHRSQETAASLASHASATIAFIR